MKLRKGKRQQSKRFRKKHQGKDREPLGYTEKCSIQGGSKQEEGRNETSEIMDYRLHGNMCYGYFVWDHFQKNAK